MTSHDRYTFPAGIIIGAIFLILGIVAYVVSDFASVTALIPTVLGIPVIALGYAGREGMRPRWAAIGLAIFAILAIGGSAMGVSDLIAWLGGEDIDTMTAAVSQGIMVLLGIVLLIAAALGEFTD